MRIIQATLSELEQVVPLFDDYRIFYGMSPEKDSVRQFLSERFKNNDSIIFLAFVEEEAVGFAQLYPTLSSISMQPTLILNDLYVANTARNSGIGTALIQQAVQYAKDNRINNLTLQTANDNLKAQKLYAKSGWKRDTEFLNYTLDL